MTADNNNKHLRLLLKDCARGFCQQMYFLGRDVLYSDGNLLQSYGFIKSPSQGLKGTSCYTYQTGSNIIELYGSCAAAYTPKVSAVFLRKSRRFYRWLPEHRLIAGRWNRSQIDAPEPYTLFVALGPLLSWWLDYESWIKDRLPIQHRESCYQQWKKVIGSEPWLPPAKASNWVSQFLKEESSHIRPKHFLL